MPTPETEDLRTVRVELGSRSYDILIGDGLIDTAGKRIAAIAPGARTAIVADETVYALHGRRLAASLDAAGIGHVSITVPPGTTLVASPICPASTPERTGDSR